MSDLQKLEDAIQPARAALLGHPIYRAVTNIEELARFMEMHCFAVWDFMFLAKRLQQEFTCTTIPWMPSADPTTAHFISEIVMGEECDNHPDGGHISHLGLYIEGMEEIGADPSCFQSFLAKLYSGKSLYEAFEAAGVCPGVREFTSYNIELAQYGRVPQVVSAFVYGREDLIPDMFQRLLDETEEGTVPTFVYYLKRHIELDGDEHGPLAMKLMQSVCGDDPQKWDLAQASALRAIEARTQLWDKVLESLEAEEQSPSFQEMRLLKKVKGGERQKRGVNCADPSR